MTNFSQLKNEWEIFKEIPYPDDAAGVEINNICITTLDTFMAGILDSCIENKSITNHRKELLKNCLEELQQVLPELEEPSKEYFSKLKTVSINCVKYLK